MRARRPPWLQLLGRTASQLVYRETNKWGAEREICNRDQRIPTTAQPDNCSKSTDFSGYESPMKLIPPKRVT